MGASDAARAFIAALEAHQWDAAAGFLANDFVLVNGPDEPTYGKATFLTVQRALQGAYPDWSFHLHISREQGNAASGSVYPTGTHTGDYIPPPGMGEATISATGKSLALPRWDVRFLLHGDMIASLTITQPPGTPIVPLFDDPASHSHTVLCGLRSDAGEPQHRDTPRTDELVRGAAFPVFGLLDNPHDLTVQGIGFGHTGHFDETQRRITYVTFRFRMPARAEEARRTFELVTSATRDESLSPPPDWREHPPETPIFDADGGQYQRYPDLAAFHSAASSEPPYLIDRFPIGDTLFAARIQRWRQPRDEWQFSLLGETVRLGGSAAGLSEDELLTLLEHHLGPITDRPDILARYQSEFDDWRRFFRSQYE